MFELNEDKMKEHDDDPYNVTGFGITSYLDTTLGIVKMFALIILLWVPMCTMYGVYNKNIGGNLEKVNMIHNVSKLMI